MKTKRPFLNCDVDQLVHVVQALEHYHIKRLYDDGASVVDCRQVYELKLKAAEEMVIRHKQELAKLPEAWKPKEAA